MDLMSCRCLCTISVFLLWFNIGIATTIEGPTLTDLKILYNTTYEAISAAVGCRGIGVIVGALITGVVVDMFKDKRLWILEILQLVFTACMVLIPLVKDTSILSMLFCAVGVSNGVTQVASNSLLLDLWQEKSAVMIPLCLVSDKVAVFLIPIALNPFLAEVKTNVDAGLNTCWRGQHHNKTYSEVVIVHPTNVQYGYLCAGVIVFLLSIPLIVTHILSNRNSPSYSVVGCEDRLKPTVKQLLNPASYAGGSLLYGSFMLWILNLYIFNSTGMYFICGTFLRSFAIDFYHFQRDNASFLLFLLQVSSFIGCMAASLMAHRMPVRVLFAVFNTLSFLSAILMRMSSSAVMLYIATVAFGLSSNPIMGHIISVANTQIETRGIVIGLFITFRGLADFVYVWLVGYKMDIYGPRTFIETLFSISTATFLYSVVFLLVAYKRGDREEIK